MKRIRISRKRNRGVWGLAFQDQNRIELDPDLSEELLLEIAVHETVHIACPDLAEEAVDRIGKAAADVLWRLGFRMGD
jgi:hypothetical protein